MQLIVALTASSFLGLIFADAQGKFVEPRVDITSMISILILVPMVGRCCIFNNDCILSCEAIKVICNI